MLPRSTPTGHVLAAVLDRQPFDLAEPGVAEAVDRLVDSRLRPGRDDVLARTSSRRSSGVAIVGDGTAGLAADRRLLLAGAGVDHARATRSRPTSCSSSRTVSSSASCSTA